MKSGISSFAWNSLNSNPPQNDRSGRKRRLQISSLQPDIDDIDSSDSCHSDGSCDIINNKRSCLATSTSHHFIPTPYAKALAESISEFEPSSTSEDDNVSCYRGDCIGDDDKDDDDDDASHVKGDGCHGDISEHQQISDSQSISSAASSPDVCIANQITTSDWLKGVVVTTPDSKTTTPVKGSSSGRRSKTPRRRISFLKCGLAEQLDRLLSRQRSEKTLWYHQMLRQQRHHGVPSGSLGVKVIRVTTSHSLCIVQAHVIQEVGLERPRNGELVTILFDDDTMKMLKLQAGSFVSICPPWHSITIRGGSQQSHVVLLSTHFCLPLSHNDRHANQHDDITDIAPISVTTEHIDESFCANEESDHRKDAPVSDRGQQPVEDSTPGDDTHKHKMMSLLEAMEQANYGYIAVTAKLWRVYQHKVSCRVAKQFSTGSLMDDFIESAKNYHQDSPSIRWFFLMEDNEGVWCEVMVDNEQLICSKEWRQLVCSGEGGQCHITDLRVVARTTKTTNPNTFSLISSILETRKSNRAVMFCYQLFATATATVEQLECEDAAVSHVMQQDLTQPHPLRITLFGQVIHHTVESDNNSGLLLATTNTEKIVTVIIKPGCVIDHHLATANSSYLFVRDAVTKQGNNTAVYCDGCSSLIPTDHHGNALNDNLCPRMLCKVGEILKPCVSQLTEATCSVGKLVWIKGTVVAVDEDNATYLPVCDACGGHLSESKESNGSLYCIRCQVTVTTPGITVELAVYLVGVGLPQYTLYVQLHKTTTSKLLPIDYSTAEEGLDVNQVLNQTLLLKACHISAIDDTNGVNLCPHVKQKPQEM